MYKMYMCTKTNKLCSWNQISNFEKVWLWYLVNCGGGEGRGEGGKKQSLIEKVAMSIQYYYTCD